MIHTDNHEHGRIIMKAIDSVFTEVTMQVISRSENGVLLGGAVYENWTGAGGSCLMHVWGADPKWINRDMLFTAFHYPFVQLDCKQIFGQVHSKNQHSIDFNKKLGWEEVITLEGVFPDGDMILMKYRRENCRFLGIKPRSIKPRVSTNG